MTEHDQELPLSPLEVLHACRAVLEQYGRGQVEARPRRERAPEPGGLELLMPARIGSWEGIKVIRERAPSVPGRLGFRTAVMMVRRPATGEQWTLPADQLTDARTGASAVLAAEFLAARGLRKAALLGTGRVARSVARSLYAAAASPDFLRLRNLESLAFYSRSPESRRSFSEAMNPGMSFGLEPAESGAEALGGAGIVFVAAASTAPVIEANQLEAGAHVSALSGSPASAALGASILLEADAVVVDQLEQCFRSGEMLSLKDRGQIDQVHFAVLGSRTANLGDAALGKIERSTDDLTLAYLSGLAILDLAVAIALIEKTGAAPDDDDDEPGPGGVEEYGDLWQLIP